jgi:hypothetical protein
MDWGIYGPFQDEKYVIKKFCRSWHHFLIFGDLKWLSVFDGYSNNPKYFERLYNVPLLITGKSRKNLKNTYNVNP